MKLFDICSLLILMLCCLIMEAICYKLAIFKSIIFHIVSSN